MKRFVWTLVVACAFAVVAVASALAAGSSGKGTQTINATCSVAGPVTVHASSGASAWVNNTHYVVVKFMGTFTPTTGSAQSFTKIYGRKAGFSSTAVQSCSGSQMSPDGTFNFTAWVAPTPAH